MSWPNVVAALQRGEEVKLNPKGNSMTPRIKSGQSVTIVPATLQDVQIGDVVLSKVKGRFYLHLVSAWVGQDRVQISNNHGHINGTTSQVFGKVIDA